MKLISRLLPVLLASGGLMLAGCDDECIPATCEELGAECGEQDDGCGGTIDCGTCDSPPAAQCDGNIAVNYGATGQCVDGQCEYEPVTEDCGNEQCVVEAGVAVCQAVTGECDYEGFEAEDMNAFADEDILELYAATSTEPPLDALLAEWWFAYGAEFTGVGTYPVENVPYDECGLCVVLYRVNADQEAYQMFLAAEGEIEVTEVGADGEPISATLTNASFVEWLYDDVTDQPVEDGETWCIDSFTWSANLEGTIP
ncbi:MAG: hypothetical protein ACOC0J_01360 [Myxococcota bacterium]